MKTKATKYYLVVLLSIFSVLSLTAMGVEGAIYITTSDNLNNAYEPIPDYDMGSSRCVFNDDPVHPIEFDIELNGPLPTNNAYLSLFILDVDWPNEVDEIYFNGHLLGYAIGQNALNYSSFFVIPNISWVRQGKNTVKVLVDKHNVGHWCADVVSGQLIIDEGTGTGTAQIRTANLDRTTYNFGESGTVNLEIDTSLASQTVRIEIILKDPIGNNIAFDTNSAGKNWTIVSNNDEPYVWNFRMPATGMEGIWTVYIAVYDAATGLFQSFRSLSFQIGTTSPGPIVSSITPNSMRERVGTAVTISGSNFVVGSTRCQIGGIDLLSLLVIDSNTITANVPPQLPIGTHSLVCSTPYGVSTLYDVFTVYAVAPEINVEPPSHDYGELQVGQRGSKTFTISNTGSSEVAIYDIGVYAVISPQVQNNKVYHDAKAVINDRNELIYLNHRLDNRVSYNGNITQSTSTTAPTFDYQKVTDNCTGITLMSGQVCTFTIDFSPRSAGIKRGEVSIFYNHPSSPYFTVSLFGKGIQANSFAFVANSLEDTVSVVDFGNAREVTKINTGSKPMGVVTIPHLKKVYITNYLSHNVTVIDGNNNNIKTIPVGANPLGIAKNPFGTRVYVGNYGDNTICEIDTSTDTVTRYYDLRGYAYGITGIVVSLDGSILYAASYANSILISLNLSTEEIRFVTVGKGPYGVAIHHGVALYPTGSTIYTADYANNTVSIISVAGSHMVFEGHVNIGGRPVGLAVNSSGGAVYVTDYDYNGIKYFDTQTRSVISISVPNLIQPFGIALDGQSGSLLVTFRGSNKLYNASMATEINVGQSPTSFGNGFIGPIDIVLPSISNNYLRTFNNQLSTRPVHNYDGILMPPHEE